MIRNCHVSAVMVLSLAAVISIPASLEADWPTFRGADRSAVSKETDLLPKWPKAGPPLVWKATGTGRGYTSLAIAKDRIFLMGDGIVGVKDADEYLVCLNVGYGKRVWATKSGPAWKEGQPPWQSSRSTPTVDGDFVYALTAQGDLFCCDVENGTEKWRKNLKSDFGGNKADDWGYSESVLVDGDQLVCTPGGDKATVVALNKLTGETLWKSVREGDRGAGHSSIVTSEIGGVRVYVQVTGSGPMGVRASDGKLLWSYPIDKATAVIPTPLIKDDLVFFTVGYKLGGALLRQIPGQNGEVSIKEVYGLKKDLTNKHGGVVQVDGYVFGDMDDQGIPFCAEMGTGKVLWKGRGSGKNSISIAAADKHLYLHFANGTMALVEATPTAYKEVSSFTVPGSGERPSWSHPVILDGKLYLREHNTVLCYDIKNKPAGRKSGGN